LPLKTNLSLPRITESLLGQGICYINLGFNQTFICNADKGFYTDVNSEIF